MSAGRGEPAMGTYLTKRLLLIIPTLLGAAALVFVIMRVIPGDPVSASLGGRVPQEEVDRIREELGYNRPILQQYVEYLGDVVRGDFGVATTDNRKITDIVFDNGMATLELIYSIMQSARERREIMLTHQCPSPY